MHTDRALAYYRVSTEQQGRSGYGLDAQRAAVERYCQSRGLEIIAEFSEVKSGRKNNRAELAKALQLAKVTGAPIVVAKLDRLSRNVSFMAQLQEGKVRFIAVDMPEADRLTLHIIAAVAEAESRMISQRTKDALAAAKARGVKLGNPNGAAPLLRNGSTNAEGIKVRLAQAKVFAEDIMPVIAEIEAAGHVTLRAIAGELNRRRIGARRGGIWHAASVHDLLKRGRAL
jgi:DNA invertase Pin-like site-specific DNA recombinase